MEVKEQPLEQGSFKIENSHLVSQKIIDNTKKLFQWFGIKT